MTEGVPWLDALRVEPSVIDVGALAEVTVIGLTRARGVVARGFGDGVDQLSTEFTSPYRTSVIAYPDSWPRRPE